MNVIRSPSPAAGDCRQLTGGSYLYYRGWGRHPYQSRLSTCICLYSCNDNFPINLGLWKGGATSCPSITTALSCLKCANRSGTRHSTIVSFIYFLSIFIGYGLPPPLKITNSKPPTGRCFIHSRGHTSSPSLIFFTLIVYPEDILCWYGLAPIDLQIRITSTACGWLLALCCAELVWKLICLVRECDVMIINRHCRLSTDCVHGLSLQGQLLLMKRVRLLNWSCRKQSDTKMSNFLSM